MCQDAVIQNPPGNPGERSVAQRPQRLLLASLPLLANDDDGLACWQRPLAAGSMSFSSFSVKEKALRHQLTDY